MDRCTGCRWKTPKKLGGQGILCQQNNGKCPSWVIQCALMYGRNIYGRTLKVFEDEELLEALRL
jgi:hypothetical protein